MNKLGVFFAIFTRYFLLGINLWNLRNAWFFLKLCLALILMLNKLFGLGFLNPFDKRAFKPILIGVQVI